MMIASSGHMVNARLIRRRGKGGHVIAARSVGHPSTAVAKALEEMGKFGDRHKHACMSYIGGASKAPSACPCE